MIIQSPGEIAFYIFDIPVYFYGIILACSVLSGVLCSEFMARRTLIPPNFFVDNSPLIIVGGILGARLYYCLLNFNYYIKDPIEIFNIRQGGLSIHGMIVVGVFIVYFLSKKYKLKFLTISDVLACSLPLAQAIGRWGNYFNSEAFGFPTKSGWGLFIPVAQRPEKYLNFELFHPTFLYESILDLFVFIILFNLFKKSSKSGIVFFTYLILYSIVRILVEYIRVDSALDIYGIPVAQIVSVLLIIVGVLGLFFINKKID